MNLRLISLWLVMKFSIIYYDMVCYIIAVCVFILFFVYFMLVWGSAGGGTVKFGSDKQAVELL